MIKLNNCKKFIYSNKIIIILIAIIIIGAFLRLYKIDLFSFADDQARDVLAVNSLIIDHKLIEQGPEFSVETNGQKGHLGSFYFYLIAPTYLFNGEPMGNVILIAIINIMAIYLMFLMGKEYFNESVGLFSALFLAISNYVLYFSRTPWNPNILICLILLVLWSLKKYLDKKENYFILFSLFLSFTLQSHASAFLLLPVLFLAFIFKLIRIPKVKTIIYSVVVFVFSFFPLVLHDIHHNFSNFRAYISLVLGGGTTPGGYVPAGNFPFWNSFFKFFENFFTINQNISQIISVIILIIILTSGIYLIIKGKKEQKLTALFFIVIVALLAFSANKNPIQTYFFLILVPFMLLVLSFFLTKAINFNRYLFIPIGIILAIFAFFSIKSFTKDIHLKNTRTYSTHFASDTLWPDMKNAAMYMSEEAQKLTGGKDKTFEINFQTCPGGPFINYQAFKYTLTLFDAYVSDEQENLVFYIVQPDTSIICAQINQSFRILEKKQFGKVIIITVFKK